MITREFVRAIAVGLLTVAVTGLAFVPSDAYAKKSKAAAPAPSVTVPHAKALDKAAKGDLKGAIRELKALAATSGITTADKDRVLMSLGRIQYELQDFDGAIASYERVSKGGDEWLSAVEESAWAEFRRDKPDATIARLKTVTSPAFKEVTRSEPFFLMGLAQLRVCDFKSLFKTIETFKSRFGDEAKKLEASASSKDRARLKEIGETVMKLNLVEAEAIQLLYMDEKNGKRRSGKPADIAKGSDQLSFPHEDSDEFWLDEVEGFRVTLKGCLRPERTDLASAATSSKKVTR